MTLLAPARSTTRPPTGRFQSFSLEPYQRESFTSSIVASANGGGEWESHICFEGIPTGDGREIGVGALKMRPGPTLPLMGLDQRTMGHMLARVCGAMGDAERRDDGTIYAGGRFAGSELGEYFEGLVTPDANGIQMLRTVSVDLEVRAMERVLIGYDDEGYEEYLTRITDANLMGVTLVPFPAFSRAIICPKGAGIEKLAEMGATDRELGGRSFINTGPVAVAASAERSAEHPPAEWFADPQFTAVTHVRVEPEVNGWRRFSGHLADWKVPHIGIGGTVYAPHCSGRDYMTKPFTVAGADGPEKIKVGVLTVGGGHAPLFKADGTHFGWKLASAHYDDPRFQGAVVVYGEDAFGPWIAGAVADTASALQVKILSHSDVSGDWRAIGGEMELVGIAAVNTAGFPVVEEAAAFSSLDVDFRAAFALTASAGDEGEMVALVAAGMVRQDPTLTELQALKREVYELKAALEPFRGLGMEWLARQMASEALESRVSQTLAARA
jgi:hypothetical protein